MMTQVAAAAAGSWAAAAEAPDWGMHLGEGVTAAAAVMAMRPEAVAMRAAAAPEAAVVAGRDPCSPDSFQSATPDSHCRTEPQHRMSEPQV